MARAATIDALRKRNIAKVDAEILVDAGFTLESLATAKLEILEKFLVKGHVARGVEKAEAEEKAKKVARRVLEKLGALKPEKVGGPKAPKAGKKVAEEKPKEERIPITIPKKVPGPGKHEEEILEALRDLGKELPPAIVRSLAEKLRGVKISSKKTKELLARVCEKYETHLIDPNESAGIVSAQSIGEPGTQMSLPYEEGVIVREGGAVRVVAIGEFVDRLMARSCVAREGGTEWTDLPPGIEVPSLRGDGRVVWKSLRAVSRHACEEPLLRVRLRSGREITATASHSFVHRRDGAIVPVQGRDLRPGDHLPVVRNLEIPSSPDLLHLQEILPPEEYWYGGEIAKARALGTGWRAGFGSAYRVPVGVDQLRNHLGDRAATPVAEGFVYPFMNHSRARIPERMPLDASLGWLVGAYLSEGWAAEHYVNISNTEAAFLRRTRRVARRFGLRWTEHYNRRGFAPGHDLHLHSAVLADLLRRSCGHRSRGKRVPSYALGAPPEFVSGLLRAYFEGDGNVSVERAVIRASSRSRDLLEGIAFLLTRFGIPSTRGREGEQHTLTISGRYASAFRDAVGFESLRKRELLDALCARPRRRYTYDAVDMVSGFGTLLRDAAGELGMPTRTVNSFTRRQRIGRETLRRHLATFEAHARAGGRNPPAGLDRLRAMAEEDVLWDEIVAVEAVPPPDRPVYDFSVPGLETFTTAEGVVTHNTMRTFHYAGVAEMNVTLGLPRLIEIVDARRVPSTPIMEIHLRKGLTELAKVRKVATEIEMTTVEDIADIETDTVNMRVLVYPDENRMKARGLAWEDLRERLEKQKKFVFVEKLARASPDGKARNVSAFVLEAGEPSFKKLQKLVDQARFTKIKGIDDIKRAILRKRGDQYVVYTEGSNLEKVLELEAVDPARTITNSIQEIYAVLGVEAARNAIIKEAYETLREQGLTVDIRHIMMVADIMTNDGDVKAIGRHGISGRKSSVLARAAFEITSHHLLRAAITGEVDALDGVAENVIVGQPVTLGTGAVNLVYQPPKKGKVAA